jgi:hypothetical protein
LPSAWTVLKLEALLAAAVLVICWLGGWRTGPEIANGFAWAGVAVIVFGVMSLVGNAGVTRTFAYQYSQSVGPLDIKDRVKAERRDRNESFAFMILAETVGILALLVGMLLHFVIV